MVHTDRVIGIALSAGPAAGIQRAMAQTFRLISVALFLSANNQEICSLVFQKSLLRHFRFGTSGRQSRCQILLGSERWDTTKYPSSSSRSKVLTIYDADVQQPDRKPARWWQNVTEVKLALAVFNEKIDSIRASERKYRKGRYRSDYSGVPTIPSENVLRAFPGGMELIHAIRQHGGFKAFRFKLAHLDATDQTPSAINADVVKSAHRHQAGASVTENSTDRPYGRYLRNGSWFLREEIVTFNLNSTNNRVWNIMPSLAQLRAAKRIDLINAIDRCGGR